MAQKLFSARRAASLDRMLNSVQHIVSPISMRISLPPYRSAVAPWVPPIARRSSASKNAEPSFLHCRSGTSIPQCSSKNFTLKTSRNQLPSSSLNDFKVQHDVKPSLNVRPFPQIPQKTQRIQMRGITSPENASKSANPFSPRHANTCERPQPAS